MYLNPLVFILCLHPIEISPPASPIVNPLPIYCISTDKQEGAESHELFARVTHQVGMVSQQKTDTQRDSWVAGLKSWRAFIRSGSLSEWSISRFAAAASKTRFIRSERAKNGRRSENLKLRPTTSQVNWRWEIGGGELIENILSCINFNILYYLLYITLPYFTAHYGVHILLYLYNHKLLHPFTFNSTPSSYTIFSKFYSNRVTRRIKVGKICFHSI